MSDTTRTPRKTLLTIEDLHVSYGKAEVVHGVSFTVGEGEFVVLLGRNGAGKSTILNAACGLVPSRAGRVVLDGEDLSRTAARHRVRAGMVPVLEGHRVFTRLSVEDNLLIGTYAKHPRGDRTKLGAIYDMFPELAERRHLQASRLSGGQQQILAVAQGVIAEPRLLILDEPSGGLAPILVARILAVAGALCATGLAVLLVEQLVEKALLHAHYGYLIETGRIAGEGTPALLRQGTLLERVYLGGHAPP
ncbi:MAG TPA: ABC transporter ATP-binding protein [Acidisphaera sp.]|nr:ABC transporter ATP-binding protein [Acidisphaera sp.]